jgi:predicted DNA-binding protein with PD1-like motif
MNSKREYRTKVEGLLENYEVEVLQAMRSGAITDEMAKTYLQHARNVKMILSDMIEVKKQLEIISLKNKS